MTKTITVSPLRQRMLEDMAARVLKPGTQRGYIRGCLRFAAFLKRSPETATTEDVRLFQLYLVESGASICTRNQLMVGVGFLLRITMRRPELAEGIYYLREPQKIPLVMSQPEIKRLLAIARGLKAQVALSFGLRLRLAGWRGRAAQGRQHRSCADDHPHRAGQGPQRPPRHAVGGSSRSA